MERILLTRLAIYPIADRDIFKIYWHCGPLCAGDVYFISAQASLISLAFFASALRVISRPKGRKKRKMRLRSDGYEINVAWNLALRYISQQTCKLFSRRTCINCVVFLSPTQCITRHVGRKVIVGKQILSTASLSLYLFRYRPKDTDLIIPVQWFNVLL